MANFKNEWRETGNEEEYIYNLWGRETNGDWVISSEFGLDKQNAEGMWSNLPVEGQGGLLWSGVVGP